MKNLLTRSLFLVMLGVFSFGCSPEDQQATSASKETGNPALQRNASSVYPEFASLFASLYGTNYDISNTTTTTIQDRGITYRYNTVTVISRGATVIKGYFIEVPGNVLYYEHDPVAKTIHEYDWSAGQYTSRLYNVGLDSFYNARGFSPTNAMPAGRRFWGYQYNLGGCGEDGAPPGQAYMYHDYYVLGVRVSHVLQTENNNTSDSPLLNPC